MNKRKGIKPGLRKLRDLVCEEYQISVEALKGESRQYLLVCARRAFCQRAWATKEYSSTEIGVAIAKDHTTVLYHAGASKKSFTKFLGPNARRLFNAGVH